MTSHNFINLKGHILPRSVSSEFDVARTEWDLVSVEVSEEWASCPCGKDIKEHCYIRNRLTKQETYVGNVCISRFMNIDTGSLFDGIKRIAKDPRANPNDAVIEYAYSQGFLHGEREYNFLKQTKNKRKQSEAQLAWKEKINRRILSKTVVHRRSS